MSRLLFVFLDGVGLGADDPTGNPLAATWPGLRSLTGHDWTAAAWCRQARGGLVTAALDARLGVPGRPQSATGQTTLLTGQNAARAMGRHYGPWPGPTLRTVLAGGNLFHDGVAAGGACLVNAYPERYVAALRSPPAAYGGATVGGATVGGASPPRARRARASAPIVAAQAAGLPLAGAVDQRRGRAVRADLATGDGGANGPDEAGIDRLARTLASLADEHAFTFFDVWVTDHAGHRGDRAAAHTLLARLDAFLPCLRAALPRDVTLLVTSDHGNLEDLGDRGHTLAAVPLVALGPMALAFAGARSLLDVAPAVRCVLGGGSVNGRLDRADRPKGGGPLTRGG